MKIPDPYKELMPAFDDVVFIYTSTHNMVDISQNLTQNVKTFLKNIEAR